MYYVMSIPEILVLLFVLFLWILSIICCVKRYEKISTIERADLPQYKNRLGFDLTMNNANANSANAANSNANACASSSVEILTSCSSTNTSNQTTPRKSLLAHSKTNAKKPFSINNAAQIDQYQASSVDNNSSSNNKNENDTAIKVVKYCKQKSPVRHNHQISSPNRYQKSHFKHHLNTSRTCSSSSVKSTTANPKSKYYYKNLHPMAIYTHPAFNSIHLAPPPYKNGLTPNLGDSLNILDDMDKRKTSLESTSQNNTNNFLNFMHSKDSGDFADACDAAGDHDRFRSHSFGAAAALSKSSSEPIFKEMWLQNEHAISVNSQTAAAAGASAATSRKKKSLNKTTATTSKRTTTTTTALLSPPSTQNQATTATNSNHYSMRKKSVSNLSSTIMNPRYVAPKSNDHSLHVSNAQIYVLDNEDSLKRSMLNLNDQEFYYAEEDLLDPRLIPKNIKKSLIDLHKRSVWNLAHQNLLHNPTYYQNFNSNSTNSANNASKQHKLFSLTAFGTQSHNKKLNKSKNNSTSSFNSNNNNNNNSNSQTSFISSNVVTQPKPKNEIKMKIIDNNSYV